MTVRHEVTLDKNVGAHEDGFEKAHTSRAYPTSLNRKRAGALADLHQHRNTEDKLNKPQKQQQTHVNTAMKEKYITMDKEVHHGPRKKKAGSGS